MPNPFFTNNIDLLPNTRARSADVESKLEAVEAGFDIVLNYFSQYVRTNTSFITTNTQAVSGGVYAMGASLTLTLPPSPSTNDWIGFSNRSGLTTCVIARNGQPIMGLAEDMNLDGIRDFGVLVYVDSTRGWVLM